MGRHPDDVQPVSLRLHFSDTIKDRRHRLYHWVSGCRRSHVHVDVDGLSLLWTPHGSGWFPSQAASRLFPACDSIHLGVHTIDIPYVMFHTDGWNGPPGCLRHLWWWYGWGRRPVDCVWLTCKALTLMGIPIECDKVDEVYDRFSQAQAGTQATDDAAPGGGPDRA